MKPTLKAPGPKLLKLTSNKLLSTFAFDFNLRRYNVAYPIACGENYLDPCIRRLSQGVKQGAGGGGLLSSTSELNLSRF